MIKVEASIIAWNSDKVNPTKTAVKKKKRDVAMEWHETSSFFNIFKQTDVELSSESFINLTNESEFFSNDLINKSLEFYLNIAEESTINKNFNGLKDANFEGKIENNNIDTK